MKKNKRIILLILFMVFMIGLVYGSYHLLNYKKESEEIIEIKETIDKLIEVDETIEENKYSIDFDSLKEKNPDTVGYLKVNNTNIDYVVVKAKNNSYYLNHNFDKNYSSSGWVFADYKNNLDGNDKNMVIYGHNMQNGSMFGTLRRVLSKKWYTNDENKYITFVTADREYTYEVFSVYTIKVEDYYINTKFKNDNDFYKFIKKLKSRSIYNFGVEVSGEDQIITLSTCSSGSSYRTVLHAKLVK